MVGHEPVSRELAKGAGRLTIHVVAMVAGFIFMVVGLAMGVSVVMLPIGIPLGLVGLLIFVWGLFGRSENKQEHPQSSGSP